MRSRDLSIIYVYFNTPLELKKSIASIKKAVGKLTYEIIIVDNASPKSIPSTIRKSQKVKVINNVNNGYGAGLNLGVKSAKGINLILVNPDIVFTDSSIEVLVKKLNKKNIGAVGPLMVNTKGKILTTTADELTAMRMILHTSIAGKFVSALFKTRGLFLKNKLKIVDREVDVISGACIAIKKKIFDSIGGFDERFFMYFEENDLCYRLKKKSYKVLFTPDAQVVHKVGASSNNKVLIEKYFEQSRFAFLKKYNTRPLALITELLLRMSTLPNILLILSLTISLIVNTYMLNTHMLFIGDFGRDYLEARKMLLTGYVPLVGIPSSVVWLHQGPLSIYFIAASLFVGNFNPVAPAFFYSILGTITILFLYILVKMWFDKRIAGMAGLLYATSPLVILSTRMPYHTSPIPFFAICFFILLTLILRGRKRLMPFAGFNLGILLLLELSNAVLLLVVVVAFLLKKMKVGTRDIFLFVLGFIVGVLPFVLHDLTNRFVQTVGFPLWILNRVRLFVGMASEEKVTSGNLPDAFFRIYQQYVAVIFPENQLIAIFFGILFIFYLYKKRESIFKFKSQDSTVLLLVWLLVPIVGFLVHAAPGVAYFPLLFPAIIMLAALGVGMVYEKFKAFIIILFIICFGNVFYLVANEYYLTTPGAQRGLPPFNYRYGINYESQREAGNAIVNDSEGMAFSLRGGGFLGELVTGIDNYKYIVLYSGGKIDPESNLEYVVYEDKRAIPKSGNVIFSNNLVFIEKITKK